MNVPHSFVKLDREVEVRVAHLWATLGAQVADSEAGARRNRLCHGHKCLPYAGKYNAPHWVPRRNISWFVVVKQLKEAALKRPCVATGIPSPMHKRKAWESLLDFLPPLREHSPKKEW